MPPYLALSIKGWIGCKSLRHTVLTLCPEGALVQTLHQAAEDRLTYLLVRSDNMKIVNGLSGPSINVVFYLRAFIS